jgi:hypothetical protein
MSDDIRGENGSPRFAWWCIACSCWHPASHAAPCARRLEAMLSLPVDADELTRLRAVVVFCNPTHAQVVRQRIEALEGRLPEARDRVGTLITPGVRVAYASLHDSALGLGVVVGIEPVASRWWRRGRTVQVHIRTESGAHVRIADPRRVLVLL